MSSSMQTNDDTVETAHMSLMFPFLKPHADDQKAVKHMINIHQDGSPHETSRCRYFVPSKHNNSTPHGLEFRT